MEVNCRANRNKIRAERPEDMSKTSKSMNHSAWEGHANEKRFMEALAVLMYESWAVVCQIRERNGLTPSYELSSSEISRRIENISKKLDEKYKEVQVLEEQKALLLNKSTSAPGPSGVTFPREQVPADFQPIASSTPSHITAYSGNYPISYSGGSGGSNATWPSTTASSGSSARSRMQYTGSSAGSPCPPSCLEYSDGAYRSYGGVDYGF